MVNISNEFSWLYVVRFLGLLLVKNLVKYKYRIRQISILLKIILVYKRTEINSYIIIFITLNLIKIYMK
ncbi:hypothetical protein BACPLE_00078 [Phocaeicola plebeius DSM 17135]|uniref:Uncharacterized protein n=1 Tax=Phocaeicola plebeius (strain DSM 17135 / JCM 12973 / CCUG 54634 / M2) TaxID=484018 RepID=B5CTK3_PHOPM|nr:hypothetical protein BACPLE_00078 [Phocaeicola plebeius DSM 17135]